ncbi:MAG: HDOD domain-containing protein [Burkholderiales bacterium]|nr:HDOD domain-containing protein [Burkholderiales bacterium]MDE2300218.1 HDOD domain-containing protein [Burkholderiales bacterium]MDE2628590.1 HDOD domain-containing protein [Burkholderiales bacterium]
MSSLAAVPMPPLTQPLRDLAAWTAHFRTAEIPVLAHTAEAIEALRAVEDSVDANGIGETIAHDPLMSLKVLAHVATHRGSRVITDAETVISALVMLGISPFFRAFGPQPTVEQRLADNPDALAGLNDTLRRAHRGANFALGFAVHRMDHDAAVLHAAALLHDFAEMLLWCFAPTLALRIRHAQRQDPTLRSGAAQLAVLNIELVDLQQSLMKAWRLPELLVRINDERHAQSPSVRNVVLALRLARHTANGWDNPAIPDDVNDIAELLNLSPEATLQLVQGI